MYVYYSIGARLDEISFTVTDELNISFVLNCSSQSGPVNKMLWLHNDESIQNSNPFPILADAQIGLYYNTLTIYGRLTGKYACEITNEFNVTIMVKKYEVDGK